MGKTLLWHHVVTAAEERGRTTIGAQPTQSEMRLSFAALDDLVSGVPEASLAALPEPQRAALDAEAPHYMLHAYFRPGGQVLFAPFDPEVTCLPDSATGDPTGPVAAVGIPVGLLVGLLLVAWVAFDRRLRTRTRP